jgi:SAM-dependent methyltransferase
MERIVYEQMAELDQRHWWYVARREVIAALIRRAVRPPANAQVLEIGCGTGHNLAMLGEFGEVDALDVIEHIEDDQGALASIDQRLKPGGKLVVTVPAHAWMWSAHDVVNHHKRRYSRRALKLLFECSPLRLDAMGYFNSLLFPLAIAERLSSRLSGKDEADLTMPPLPLNAALEKVFAAERHLVGRVPLPPGLSLFAVASAI